MPSRFTPILFLALLTAACQSAPQAAPEPEPEPIPAVELDGLSDTARTAISAARSAAEAHPDDVSVVGQLGKSLHAYGQLNGAIAAYHRAAALDSEAFEWQYLAGLAYHEAGQAGPAEEAFRRALDLNPNYLPAELHLAQLLQETNQLPASYALYSTLRRREPQMARIYYGLGEVDAAARRYERSISLLKRAIELDPAAGGSYRSLAQVYESIGRPAEAEDQLGLAEALPPDAPPFSDPLHDEVAALRTDWPELLAKAESLEAAGSVLLARDAYQDLLPWPQGGWRGHAGLTRILAELDDPAGSETHFLAAKAQRPDRELVYYSRGVALLQNEQFGDAEAALREAVALAPGSHRSHAALARALRELGLSLEAEAEELTAAKLLSADRAHGQAGSSAAGQRASAH